VLASGRVLTFGEDVGGEAGQFLELAA
jgi:hypothetical protein